MTDLLIHGVDSDRQRRIVPLHLLFLVNIHVATVTLSIAYTHDAENDEKQDETDADDADDDDAGDCK